MTLPPARDSHNTSLVNQHIPIVVQLFIISQLNTAVNNGLFRIEVVIPTEMMIWGLPLMWWLKDKNYISFYKDLGATGQLNIQW